VSSHICPTDRHGEEETQRRNRVVDGRRTYPGLRLMQLEASQILRRGCIGRATEEGRESADVPDIVVARLLDEIAHAHVFDHALAQWADGLLAHRGAPVLRLRLLAPLDPQDGTPSCHRTRLTQSSTLARLAPASRAARSRVSGFAHWHKATQANPVGMSGVEAFLEKRFGSNYIGYKEKVRRWL
jgi:hypothetical protein